MTGRRLAALIVLALIAAALALFGSARTEGQSYRPSQAYSLASFAPGAALGDACDADDDNDTLPDVNDPDPLNPVGDGLDTDGDWWSDADEVYLGTDPLDSCTPPANAWPLDQN